jgi:hypothetical protein
MHYAFFSSSDFGALSKIDNLSLSELNRSDLF